MLRATLGLRPTVIIAAACIVLAWLTSVNVSADARVVRIVVLGDSLTAGWGVPAGDAFPDKLQSALRARGQSTAVSNAGVSGDTAAMGLARLHRSITEDTDAAIVELGANDMLGGLDPISTRAALVAILHELQARQIVVLLCGVRTQPGLGDDYKSAFASCSPVLPGEYNVLVLPRFRRCVCGQCPAQASGRSAPHCGRYRSGRHADIAESRGLDRPSA